ncbi:MAG: Ig-like domain-containing protein, partial [Cellvibrionaceae bacterium]|nr:Ig-like domain-containing protein [Cellvibrionaceae bacterium]
MNDMSNPDNNLSKQLVGTVSEVVGDVTLEGQQEPLQVGDPLPAGKKIWTGEAGALAMRFDSGGAAILGNGEVYQLETDEVRNTRLDALKAKLSQKQQQALENDEEIQGIIKALEEGRVLEDISTEAGGSSSSSLYPGIRFEFSQQQVLPEQGGFEAEVEFSSSADNAVGEESSHSLIASAPSVEFPQDSNGDGYLNASEIDGQVIVRVNLPSNARVGAVVEAAGQTVELTQAHIDAGLLDIVIDVSGDSLAISATVSNPDMPPGPASQPVNLILDTEGPSLTVDASADYSDGSYVVTGSAEAGAVIEVRDSSGVLLGSATVTADGNWSIDVAATPDGQTQLLNVRAEDAAGNVVEQSRFVEIISIDEGNSGGETGGDAGGETDGSETGGETGGGDIGGGTGGEGGIANNVRLEIVDGGDELLDTDEVAAVAIRGQVPIGAQVDSVVISDGENNTINVAAESIVVAADGTVLIEAIDLSTLVDGQLTATLTFSADGSDVKTVSDTVNKDVFIESDPIDISFTAISDDTGRPGDFSTADRTLSVSGRLSRALAEHEHLEISNDNGQSWIDVDDISGQLWSFQDGTVHDNGQFSYQVRVVGDKDTVVEAASQQITVDTQAPGEGAGAPHSISFSEGADGFLNTSEIETVALEGAIEAGDTIVSIVIAGPDGSQVVPRGDISVGSGGAVSVSPQDLSSLGDGELTINMTVRDVNGNTGTISSSVTKDTQVGGGAGATDPANNLSVAGISEDSGRADDDFITNDARLTVSGTLDAELASDEFVEVSSDGENWARATVTNTNWSYDDPAQHEDGEFNYQVRIVDAAGNVGAQSEQTVTVDTNAPGGGDDAVEYTIEITGNGDELLSSEEIAGVQLQAQIATDDTISSIIFSDGNSSIAVGPEAISISEEGLVSVEPQDLSALVDGQVTVTMTLVDVAGNIGAISDVITKDTQVSGGDGANDPALSDDSYAISEDTGLAGDFITSDTVLTVSGELSQALLADERLEISLDGETWQEATVDGVSWSYQDPSEHPDGELVYQIRVVDTAGNIGLTGSQTVQVDTTAPGEGNDD